MGKESPIGVAAHSTGGAATSAVYEGEISPQSICRAVTWATINIFIGHYKIDKAALAEAAFGHGVQQKVIPQ